MLHEVVKEPGCVGGLSSASNNEPGAELELATPARTLGITLTPVSIQNTDELSSGFDQLTRQHCRAVIVMSDPLFVGASRHLVELTVRHRAAASYDNKLIVH